MLHNANVSRPWLIEFWLEKKKKAEFQRNNTCVFQECQIDPGWIHWYIVIIILLFFPLISKYLKSETFSGSLEEPWPLAWGPSGDTGHPGPDWWGARVQRKGRRLWRLCGALETRLGCSPGYGRYSLGAFLTLSESLVLWNTIHYADETHWGGGDRRCWGWGHSAGYTDELDAF